jgi:hypothetical protein
MVGENGGEMSNLGTLFLVGISHVREGGSGEIPQIVQQVCRQPHLT